MRAKFSMMSQWGGSRAHTILRGLSKLIWQWKIHIAKKGGVPLSGQVCLVYQSLCILRFLLPQVPKLLGDEISLSNEKNTWL